MQSVDVVSFFTQALYLVLWLSLPLKLFLFVMVDGWSRLIQGLVLTYA